MVAKPCRICVLRATDEAPFFSFPTYPVLDIFIELSIPILLNNSNTANVKIWDNLQDILSI